MFVRYGGEHSNTSKTACLIHLLTSWIVLFFFIIEIVHSRSNLSNDQCRMNSPELQTESLGDVDPLAVERLH